MQMNTLATITYSTMSTDVEALGPNHLCHEEITLESLDDQSFTEGTSGTFTIYDFGYNLEGVCTNIAYTALVCDSGALLTGLTFDDSDLEFTYSTEVTKGTVKDICVTGTVDQEAFELQF
jgi:hypothetical protein